jgi:hypothetical protein
MKGYTEVEMNLHLFLLSILGRYQCSATRSGHFYSGVESPTPIGQEAFLPQNRSGLIAEENENLSLLEIHPSTQL